MIAVAVLMLVVLPLAVFVGLLRLLDARQRRRADVVARQIALTDAIHAVLGPVVAPLVRRRRGGRWIAVLPVRPGDPELGVMVDIAQATLGAAAQIVLVEQEPVPARRRPVPASGALALSGPRPTR
jgi:hypothetical protein